MFALQHPTDTMGTKTDPSPFSSKNIGGKGRVCFLFSPDHCASLCSRLRYMRSMERFFSSKIYFTLCVGGSFLVGAAGASLIATLAWLPFAIGSIFILIFGLIVAKNVVAVRFAIILLLSLVLGATRFIIALPTNTPGEIQSYADKQMVAEGVIHEEPDRRIGAAQYVVKVERLTGKTEPVRGRLLIKTPLYPEYAYGDRLKISCRLAKPEVTPDGFHYEKYLANQNIFVTCENPRIEKLSAGNGSWLFAQILRFKNFVGDRINQVWSEPESSFMAGILYGSRAGLPPEITDLFNKTGVTHIIAVSGSNISIIVVAVMSTLLTLRVHRRKASWAVGIFIVVFVIFTGASASVVRAGIMGGIALLGKIIGRPVRMSIVLMVTAVLMTIVNPYVLMWDAGFQLSFLATMGLIYISPVMMERISLRRVPGFVAVLLENGVTTMAAIVATLPLMLFQFGRLSMVAPIVNVLILWTIPYVMLGGFIATIVGMFYVPLGIIAAVPSVALMEYILHVVAWFGSLPFAAATISLPWWGMLVLYIGIIGVVGWQHKNISRSSKEISGV